MIHLSTYIENILEAKEKKKVTAQWLKDHYPVYNEQYFNNELPKVINLTVMSDSGNDALAWQGFSRAFYVSSKYVESNGYQMFYKSKGKTAVIKNNTKVKWEPIVDEASKVTDCKILQPYICFNTIYELTEDELESTLIHEMVHLHNSKDGLMPKRAHGKEFTAKCKEIMKLAKEKYNKTIVLSTKAENHNEYGLSKEEQDNIKNKLLDSFNKGVLGVYLKYSDGVMKTDNPYKERMFFCTKNVLKKLLPEITTEPIDKDYLEEIRVSDTAYVNICAKLGVFKKVTTYKFYDVGWYKKNGDYEELKKMLLDNSVTPKELGLGSYGLNESKKQEQDDMIELVGATGDLDIEDIVDVVDNEEEKNDKNLITPKK